MYEDFIIFHRDLGFIRDPYVLKMVVQSIVSCQESHDPLNCVLVIFRREQSNGLAAEMAGLDETSM